MVTIALALLLAQVPPPAISGERSFVPQCEVSEDADYGYTKDTPIRVGGLPMFGASRQQRYLRALVGPAGQPITFKRRGSLAPNRDEVIIDLYEVTYAGLEKPIELYLDFYRWDPPKAPRGFLCGQDIGLMEPRDPEAEWQKVVALAIEKGAREEIPPIPLGADGSTRYGVAIDAFRFVAGAARALAAAGETVTPALVGSVRPGQFLIVAHALDCGGEVRRPTKIEVVSQQKQMLPVRGNLMTHAELAKMLPWMRVPDGAAAVMVGALAPPAGGEVRLTYDGPVCPGAESSIGLPVVSQAPEKVVDAKPSWPVSVKETPGGGAPLQVRIGALIDLDGVPTDLRVIGPPSVFNLPSLAAVRQWRYGPVKLNGAPIYAPVVMTVTVTFRGRVRGPE